MNFKNLFSRVRRALTDDFNVIALGYDQDDNYAKMLRLDIPNGAIKLNTPNSLYVLHGSTPDFKTFNPSSNKEGLEYNLRSTMFAAEGVMIPDQTPLFQNEYAFWHRDGRLYVVKNHAMRNAEGSALENMADVGNLFSAGAAKELYKLRMTHPFTVVSARSAIEAEVMGH